MLVKTPANSQNAASFSTPADQASAQTLSLLNAEHPERAYAEAFIQEIFFSSYQARITHFYPQLFCIMQGNGDYTAVAGVRSAASHSLFSEYYLDHPIESLLGVPRQQIVEIGNLSPANIGQARWLIATLNAFMAAAGFTHVVFTAVPRLRNAFHRMGLPLTRLSEASPARLPAGMTRDWGNYYAATPAVFSGDIRIGENFLVPRAKDDQKLILLRQHASELGQQFANDKQA